MNVVNAAAVVPAPVCETEDTGVKSRLGCTWWSGPYCCRVHVGTFAAACLYI